MEIIDQHTKKIMEECKDRAREEGLQFDDNSLEYIITNQDMLELAPKGMIPTLYDYWVQDVHLLGGEGQYELYPHNPYETVINTRPAISFYNDNNPDWLNVMIFYHVLGHIDFFQNNAFFNNTHGMDFTERARAHKRLINDLRSEHGRWADYMIEFSRGIDNIVFFHDELSDSFSSEKRKLPPMEKYYFGAFLQKTKKVGDYELIRETARYNKNPSSFWFDVATKYPEFKEMFRRSQEKKEDEKKLDMMEYIMENSHFLNREENKWMKDVIHVVRKTSLYFQPQIRTKIINEGWASYWHEKLFIQDERIKTHEVDFALINAGVMAMPRAGLNPYALGQRLLQYVEEQAEKGKLSYDFNHLRGIEERENYHQHTGKGKEHLFNVRGNFDDFQLLNEFIDQDFVDKHKLFVAGRRVNPQTQRMEVYIKSKAAEDYKKMAIDSLYHPPYITLDESKGKKGWLYLDHHFEGKEIMKDYIQMVMIGLESLWGRPVQFETSELTQASIALLQQKVMGMSESENPVDLQYDRVLYTVKNMQINGKRSY